VRKLVDKVGYRQNVIILTAMLRWINNTKTWNRGDIAED
jgi:hypothetical protein